MEAQASSLSRSCFVVNEARRSEWMLLYQALRSPMARWLRNPRSKKRCAGCKAIELGVPDDEEFHPGALEIVWLAAGNCPHAFRGQNF